MLACALLAISRVLLQERKGEEQLCQKCKGFGICNFDEPTECHERPHDAPDDERLRDEREDAERAQAASGQGDKEMRSLSSRRLSRRSRRCSSEFVAGGWTAYEEVDIKHQSTF